jgi:hypothetical protein
MLADELTEGGADMEWSDEPCSREPIDSRVDNDDRYKDGLISLTEVRLVGASSKTDGVRVVVSITVVSDLAVPLG